MLLLLLLLLRADKRLPGIIVSDVTCEKRSLHSCEVRVAAVEESKTVQVQDVGLHSVELRSSLAMASLVS